MPRIAKKHVDTLSERLAAHAQQLRGQAASLLHGAGRDELLRKADHCEAAADIDGWLRSAELRPPE